MDGDPHLQKLQQSAASELAALSAVGALLREDLALGLSALLRCLLWSVLALVAALGGLLLLAASSVAAALWAGLAWPWALLVGALFGSALSVLCAALARQRLGQADLSATRRQVAALLASLAGQRP